MSNDRAKISSSALNALLGITPTRLSSRKSDEERTINSHRLTHEEYSRLMGEVYVPPDRNRGGMDRTSAQGIRSYLEPIAESIGERYAEIKKMRALAPEIEQSKLLVASSILSPNDLGEGTFNFVLDSMPTMTEDPDLKLAIQKVLSEHFNDNLKLGISSFDWIGEALYGSGAKALMLLPHATLEEAIHKQVSPQEGSYFSYDTNTEAFPTRIRSKSKSGNDGYNHFFYSESGKMMGEWLDELDNVMVTTECYPVIKDSTITLYDKDDDAVPNDEEYMITMEKMVAHLKKTLSSGDIIKISEDPSIMKWTTTNKQKNKDKVLSAFGANKYFMQQDIISLNPNPEKGHRAHPMIVELPTESVIPIHVPGSPKEHLGYFVLIDPYGQPIKYNQNEFNLNPLQASQQVLGGTQTSASSAHTAIFGADGSTIFGGTSKSQAVGNLLFSTILDKYVKSRIKGVLGDADLEVTRFQAIANVMLRRLMANKRTTLLYVPSVLMNYIAFDHLDNGCGKSRLEDLRPLLAMRTNLMMAQIIAAANNAIEHKTIQFDTPDNLANLEGIMEIIHQVFQRKRNVTGSFLPDEISSNMYSNRVTVLPSKIPGLDGSLKVDVDAKGGNSIAPDNTLLEHLDNLIGSTMIMHPSALNSINEPEHSRSLATINMFYSKQITQLQTIFCKYMTTMVQSYIQFSEPLQKTLLDTIKGHYQSISDSNVPKGMAKKLRRGDTNLKYSRGHQAILQEIVAQIEVRLPAPNIIVGKSQFEEVKAYVDIIQQMSEILFGNEMILSSNQEALDALNLVKAHWRYNQIKEFTSRVGDNNLYELPEVDNFIEIVDLSDGLIQSLLNIQAKYDGEYRTIIGARQEMDAQAAADDMGMGDDGDMGMGDDMGGGDDDMDMGGDDDMDMGGDDLGGDDFDSEPDDDDSDEQDEDPNTEAGDTQSTQMVASTSNDDSLESYVRNIAAKVFGKKSS